MPELPEDSGHLGMNILCTAEHFVNLAQDLLKAGMTVRLGYQDYSGLNDCIKEIIHEQVSNWILQRTKCEPHFQWLP